MFQIENLALSLENNFLKDQPLFMNKTKKNRIGFVKKYHNV